jgi:hypothetical protein
VITDAQHQELTSFLARLVSDEHAPDPVHEIAVWAYGKMFDPDAAPPAGVSLLRLADDAVWTTLERAGYLPPDYVLGAY